ncbi:MAG TPA: hypothetical protein VM598_00950, partial [Bdellovibrionota bacterium]|nr:hypothetical protein [Bdellovibrionota bacterium]
MVSRTLFLLLLLFSLPALAAQGKYAFLAGGSGEFEGKNFFLDDLADFRKGLLARGWDVSVVAGPGGLPAPFTAAATNLSIISGLKRTLSQAEKGDQVLVLFHSHGHRRETDWGQRSHSIVTERADPAASDGSLDLDRIEPLIQKA